MDAILSLMGVVLLVLAPFPMILAIERLIPPVEDSDSPSHIWLIRLFLWLMLQMTIAHLLGMSGFLFRSAVVAAELFMCVFGLLLTFNMKVRPSPRRQLPGLHLAERTMLLLLISIWLPVIFYYTIRPFSEHDTIAYHLPTIVTWMQSHKFVSYSQFANDAVNYYPYGWQALCSLFLILGKNDAYIILCNFAALILMGLSAYRLTRCIGASRISALGAVCLLLSMPIFILNAGTMHTDLPMAAFFTAGLLYLYLLYRSQDLFWLGILIADLGLICANKASGIAYAALLLVGCCIFLVIRRHFIFSRLWGFPLFMIISGLNIFTVTGGFWFAHNWLSIGNPFGFLEVKVGPILLFQGPMDSSFIRQTSLAGLFQPTNILHLKTLLLAVYHNLDVAFIALCIMFFCSIIQSRRLIKSANVFILLLLCATVILYWHSPFSGDNGLHKGNITSFIGDQMRFAFPAITVLAVGASMIQIPLRFKYYCILCMSAAMLWSLWHIAGVNFLLASGVLLIIFLLAHRLSLMPYVIVLVSSFILVVSCIRKERSARESLSIYSVLTLIPDDEPVGYMLGYQAYPLFGPDWTQRVQFIHEGEFADRNDLCMSLNENGIKYLAVGPAIGIYNEAREIGWIESDARFVSVLGNNPQKEMVIYKLNVLSTYP